MIVHLPPEEPPFGPWKVKLLRAFVQSIQKMLPKDVERPGIVAIDGRSASGQTTLATLVNQAVPGSVVVHIDDIPSSGNWPGMDAHSPPRVGSATRPSFYDWAERLLINVLEPVRAGQTVQYRPQAWADWFREEGAIEVPPDCPVLVLEGVGAARRELMHAVDVVVWVQSDVERAKTRGIARDGGDATASAFWETWMAEEFPFLADQRPWERANIIVSGTPDLEHDPTSQVVVAV